MAVRPASLAHPVAGRSFRVRGVLEREGVFGWLMLGPGVLFLLAFVAYPFFYGIFLSLEERRVPRPGPFGRFAHLLAPPPHPVLWPISRNNLAFVPVPHGLEPGGGLRV